MPSAGLIATFPSASFATLRGTREVVTLANPAVGTDWTYTIPGGYYKRFIAIRATLVSSAVVANRLVGFNYVIEGTSFLQVACTTALTASQTDTFYINPGASAQPAGANAGRYTAVMQQQWLKPGDAISSTTLNIDVGDQWSALSFWFENMDFGPYGEPIQQHGYSSDDLDRSQLRPSVGMIPENPPRGPRG